MFGSISIKAWCRPIYLLRSLNALSKCHGIENYRILLSCDHYDTCNAQQILETIYASPVSRFKNFEVIIHETNLGCAGNTRYCFERAFENGEDFHIHMEDDHILSVDALEFFEDVVPLIGDSHFAVCSMNRPCHQDKPIFDPENDYEEVLEDAGELYSKLWFEPAAAFAITKKQYDRIQEMGGIFGVDYISEKGKSPHCNGQEWLKEVQKSDRLSWGWPFQKYFSEGKPSLFPIIGRCLNIGKSGLHTNYNKYVEIHENNHWMGNPSYPNNIYEDRYYFDAESILKDNKIYFENGYVK